MRLCIYMLIHIKHNVIHVYCKKHVTKNHYLQNVKTDFMTEIAAATVVLVKTTKYVKNLPGIA